jgi:hypothetical protein
LEYHGIGGFTPEAMVSGGNIMEYLECMMNDPGFVAECYKEVRGLRLEV